MADIDVKSGDMEVLSSGTIVQKVNESVSFTLEGARIAIAFNDSTTEEKPRLERNIVSESEVHFTLFGFSNPLGTSWTAPILKSEDGAKIHFTMACYLIGQRESGTRVIHFTWARKEPAHGD